MTGWIAHRIMIGTESDNSYRLSGPINTVSFTIHWLSSPNMLAKATKSNYIYCPFAKRNCLLTTESNCSFLNVDKRETLKLTSLRSLQVILPLDLVKFDHIQISFPRTRSLPFRVCCLRSVHVLQHGQDTICVFLCGGSIFSCCPVILLFWE